MSPSSSRLCRKLFSLVFVSAFSLVVSQLDGPCPQTGYDYIYPPCTSGCPSNGGYCTAQGHCSCGEIP
jgi:hypothetical protein